MAQHEFDPAAHEIFVETRLEQLRVQAARMAIFDELIDYAIDGICTFDEAVTQYLHDIERDGIGYESVA
jgi:hypothetical protein